MKAKRLELRLPAEAVQPLLDLLMPLALETGAGALASTPDLDPIEEDFREQWREDLAEHLGGDFGRFVAVFGTAEFRESGVVDFGPDDCDALLRAAAALRLKLRDRKLNAVADTTLETGEVDIARLNKEEQQAMLAYVFLATFQEIIIRFLDPGAAAAE
jgi:hypothetical protein